MKTHKLGKSNLEVSRRSGAVAVGLTPDDLGEIESGAAKITLQGARYPEHLQKLVGR